MKTIVALIAGVVIGSVGTAGAAQSWRNIPVGTTFVIPSVDAICKAYANGVQDEGPFVGCVRKSNLYTGRSREVFITPWQYRITDSRNTKVVYTAGRTP